MPVPARSQSGLHIVLCGGDSYCDDVSKMAHHLGHEVTVLPFSNDPSTRSSIDASDLVLFVPTASGAEASLFLELLRETKSTRSIALISDAAARNKQLTTAAFSESIPWPCTALELRSKIAGKAVNRKHRTQRLPSRGLSQPFDSLVGRSAVFVQALRCAERAARCDAPLLLEGETGTGKELVARSVHGAGPRAQNAFVPVNCGALPDNLLENELFGHERGAYTDASAQYFGLVPQADKGTLFLDELDALSPKAQVALLRFVEDQEFRPLGGKQIQVSDVRIIAASNANLVSLVKEGRFRKDLYYRLSVIEVSLPPLRYRTGDIELLAAHFTTLFGKKYDRPKARLSRQGLTHMLKYSWPGNVREMQASIHREILMGTSDRLEVNPLAHVKADALDSAATHDFHGTFQEEKRRVTSKFEFEYLCWVMKLTQGNVTRAAIYSGQDRRDLGRLLKKYAIDRNRFASPQVGRGDSPSSTSE